MEAVIVGPLSQTGNLERQQGHAERNQRVDAVEQYRVRAREQRECQRQCNETQGTYKRPAQGALLTVNVEFVAHGDNQ